MSQPSKSKHGTFSWVELITSNQEAARGFYTSTFGWTGIDIPTPGGLYTLLQNEGVDVAGLYEMSEEQREHDTRPHWLTYVSVADVDAVTKEAVDQGATVINPPADVDATERISILQDPLGAVFGLRQEADQGGAGLVNEPGSFCWTEHVARESQEVTSFYRDLFDWNLEASEEATRVVLSTSNGGEKNAIGSLKKVNEGIAPHWRVYFGVGDFKTSTTAIEEYGGTLLGEKMEVEGLGRVVNAADPQGAIFSIVHLEPEEQAE